MATDLDRISSLQALADSTCLIYDRAVTPEKVVGQAWLISKGRVVTLASSVANYVEAPWALTIRFPHPDITYGVRTITVHPDFNKREARDYYLAQSLGPVVPPVFENDIATVALESDLSPPAPERLSELNRALSIPFEISPQDMSGSMRPGDIPAILQSALSTGRSGLISMVDSRNIPFARIALRQARIVRASFNNLYNEVAVCELLWRKQAGNFAFQPVDMRWPADIPEISTPTDQILSESVRRADELPRIIENLGGPEARFAKATKLADFSSINPNERWVAERLWEALDGYLPLSKVADRVGTDTYSCMKMVWDFATMGLINSNGGKGFHGSGQLGPMLVPAQDLDMTTWDPLTAFYLDPISGGPNAVQGNFFGSAHLLNTKTLLHNIPLPPTVQPAAILKEGKLVGIHTGNYVIRVPNAPTFALQRMMWIGSLNDLGTKRLRTAEASVDELDEEPQVDQTVSQKISGLRTRNAPGTADASTVAPVVAVEETGPLAKYSKMQIAGVSAAVFAAGLVMLLVGLFTPHPAATVSQDPSLASTSTSTAAEPPKPTPAATPEAPANADLGDAAAAKVAMAMAGIKGAPPSGFIYKDTAKLTDPRASFGLSSEYKNVEFLFVEWPNPMPITNLEMVAHKMPFWNYARLSLEKNEFTGKSDNTNYVAGHYQLDNDRKATCVVGSFQGLDPTHSVVFMVKPISGDSLPDVAFPARIVEELLASKKSVATAGGTKDKGTDDGGTLATPEQLANYRKKLQATIKANYKPPQAEEGADTKVGLAFSIDAEGNVADLARKPSNPNDDFNKALQKALESAKPLPPPPKTKTGKYSMLLTANDGQVTLDEQ